MSLFVDCSIDIHAPASAVWAALTQQEYTDQWAAEFSNGGGALHIESDWQLGSPVAWKMQDGTVMVEGAVTACEPETLLRYTVFDTRHPRPATKEEDGITYMITEGGCHTVLRVRQGDFSSIPDGQTHRDASEKIWKSVLETIAFLAERM